MSVQHIKLTPRYDFWFLVLRKGCISKDIWEEGMKIVLGMDLDYLSKKNRGVVNAMMIVLLSLILGLDGCEKKETSHIFLHCFLITFIFSYAWLLSSFYPVYVDLLAEQEPDRTINYSKFLKRYMVGGLISVE